MKRMILISAIIVQQDFYVVLKQRYETNPKQGLSGHRVPRFVRSAC
jgi:hypothetical protein